MDSEEDSTREEPNHGDGEESEDVTLNREAHHTQDYSSPGLIVRRGHSFNITLRFSLPISKWKSIIFTVQTGPPEVETSKTKIAFPVTSFLNSGRWGAVLESSDPNSLNMIIASPANAVIGRYKLSVEVTINEQPATYGLGNFILLFNPWCTEDVVYMADENERQEYVLNDSGILYMGNEKYVQPFGWNYGQFEDDILNICLELLDLNTNYRTDPVKDYSQRSDAIYVGRVISAMVNSNDDYGVVEGRWDGNFSDGEDPNHWSSSVEILTKWQREGYKPVKYGQCWVFAGVMCTVLRCLGIPTRVITNFNSAHNTDANLSIDLYYDENGKFLDDITVDSIWNFHVWNESWFIRRDLGTFYDGWQVLDSTPQEPSQGLYRCGPTSVKAVKEGDVQLSYDGPFVFAEVNADRVDYLYHSADNKERVETDTTYVGQSMSTKSVGSDERIDVTDLYKYAEGSEMERAVFNKAVRRLQNPASMEDDGAGERNNSARTPERVRDRIPRAPTGSGGTGGSGISGKFKLTSTAVAGDDISLVLNLKNVSADRKNVQVKLSCSSILYTGRRLQDIFTTYKYVTIEPRGEATIPLDIFYSEYEGYYGNNTMLSVTALCEVPNAAKVLIRRDIALDSPPINIRVLDQAVVYEPVTVEVRFSNPLMLTVKDCILVAEGSGLIDGQFKAALPSMRPKQRMRYHLNITPWRSGTQQLLVYFKSESISMKGFKSVDVAERKWIH
ncbi:protein-glutamine gamma-glutamyltransferase E-like [Ambystoma mexicanum]|uniref:protein-glutamine gamma-glutamyltransferase E-like n=1 Tax=Ambystoma mexicanum TaxID=8296 RepID=UPI0037E85539